MAPQYNDAGMYGFHTSNNPADSIDAVNLGLHLDDHSWIQRTYDLFKATVQMSTQFSQQQKEQNRRRR